MYIPYFIFYFMFYMVFVSVPFVYVQCAHHFFLHLHIWKTNKRFDQQKKHSKYKFMVFNASLKYVIQHLVNYSPM